MINPADPSYPTINVTVVPRLFGQEYQPKGKLSIIAGDSCEVVADPHTIRVETFVVTDQMRDADRARFAYTAELAEENRKLVGEITQLRQDVGEAPSSPGPTRHGHAHRPARGPLPAHLSLLPSRHRGSRNPTSQTPRILARVVPMTLTRCIHEKYAGPIGEPVDASEVCVICGHIVVEGGAITGLLENILGTGPHHPAIIPMPSIQVIPPMVMCHLCLDLVDIGIITEDEARPAVVVIPRAGSLCVYHRMKLSVGRVKVDDDQREILRKSLVADGFLVEPQVGQYAPTGFTTLYGPNDTGGVPNE